MALKIYDTIHPDGDYPAVNAAHVAMPDGRRLSDFDLSVDTEIPVFDLEKLGLDPIPFGGGSAEIETDTAEIVQALMSGLARFAIPIAVGTTNAAAVVTCTSCVVSGMAYIANATIFVETLSQIVIDVYPDGVSVGLIPVTEIIDDYMEEALGGDY